MNLRGKASPGAPGRQAVGGGCLGAPDSAGNIPGWGRLSSCSSAWGDPVLWNEFLRSGVATRGARGGELFGEEPGDEVEEACYQECSETDAEQKGGEDQRNHEDRCPSGGLRDDL